MQVPFYDVVHMCDSLPLKLCDQGITGGLNMYDGRGRYTYNWSVCMSSREANCMIVPHNQCQPTRVSVVFLSLQALRLIA